MAIWHMIYPVTLNPKMNIVLGCKRGRGCGIFQGRVPLLWVQAACGEVEKW